MAVILLPAGAASAGAVMPPGIGHVTSVEGIAEYRLANGLKVLLLPDASKPTLTINITYLAGSRHENYGETGMAHLLEHLVFKGTPSHPNLIKEFDQRGARFNGSTTPDYTNYFELLPATDDNLAWVLAMEADRMVNSFIAKKDLDSEMTVVRNEFEMGENHPHMVMYKRLQSIAYDWHSYGRSTIGNRSDIENVRIENLQAFYRAYYQPDSAVLVIAGRFDPAKALQLVAASFGRIPRPQRILPPQWTVEPTQDGERSFTVRRKDDLQMVWVAYKVPSNMHPQSIALALAAKMLGDAPTGRLHKALVESGKAAEILILDLTGHAPGLQIFGAVVKKGDSVEAVRDVLIAQVESFGTAAPGLQALERARINMRNQLDRMYNDHEEIGRMLSDYIALGDWRMFFKVREGLAKVGGEEIAAVASHYYRRDNRTVGIYLPEDKPQRSEIPPAPAIAEIMKDFAVAAQDGEVEAFDPSPANLDARTRRLAVGGVRLALLPKKNRGETVAVSMRIGIGDEKSLFGKQAVQELTAAMLGRGTARMSRAELADAHDKLKMSGDFLEFQTARPHLAEALRLAAHALRDASFPPAEFDQLKKEALARLEATRNDPHARGDEAIERHLNRYPKGDPRYVPTLDERLADIEAVTLEQVRQFHREFYGATNMLVAIVGDFDAEAVPPVIESEFGRWQSRRPYARVRWAHAEVAAARLTISTPDKENAMLKARLDIAMSDEDPDYAALLVANTAFGGSPASRLMERLRQKDGLSYGAGSGLNASAWDDAAYWRLGAIAAPQNIGKVEAAIRQELTRALRDGFPAAETAAAIDNLLQMHQQNRAQDGFVARTWLDYLERGRSFAAWSERLERQIKAVTPAAASAAFRKYVKIDKLTLAIAADPARQ